MSARIYSIDAIDLALLKSNPPSLQILCMGRVPTSGWSNPQLIPFNYVTPPVDGVQDFDAVATPPDTGVIVIPVLTPVTAETTLPSIDLANYWAPGMPLNGIRCHATSNSKSVGFGDPVPGMPGMREFDGGEGGDAPGFEAAIKPLFRLRDAAVMRRISGFDLHNYDDVAQHADRILSRLEDGTMPCDGAWPRADTELFKEWIEAGKPA